MVLNASVVSVCTIDGNVFLVIKKFVKVHDSAAIIYERT